MSDPVFELFLVDFFDNCSLPGAQVGENGPQGLRGIPGLPALPPFREAPGTSKSFLGAIRVPFGGDLARSWPRPFQKDASGIDFGLPKRRIMSIVGDVFVASRAVIFGTLF